MTTRVATLDELNQATAEAPWLIDLVLPDVGGGKATLAALEAIDRNPSATALRVSGLGQRELEMLVARFGSRFSAIHFWKCPRVEDLSPLEDLSSLTHVAYYWNQRATRLWDLTQTPHLKGLQFEDFSRLRRLDDLAAGTSLEELTFGDAIWMKNAVESLAPLGCLQTLRRLSFALGKIADGKVQPLAALQQLEYLECPTNLFTTEQLAWLRARLPETVRSRVLSPLMMIDPPLPGGDGRPPRDVLVIGKRKPLLSSSDDAKKVTRYTEEFWHMVSQFRDDPELEPKPT